MASLDPKIIMGNDNGGFRWSMGRIMTNALLLVVMLACMRVEGNPTGKPTDSGYTQGQLCISRDAVVDVNKAYGTRYTFRDMRNRQKAMDVFVKYANRWHAQTPEEIARIHNGGPDGMHKRQTKAYWRKVAAELMSPRLRTQFMTALAIESMKQSGRGRGGRVVL